jgi:CheY-like chemotaxis protein
MHYWNVKILKIQIDNLWHLLLNIIKNAVNAQSTKVTINICEKDSNLTNTNTNTNSIYNTNLLIYITDNGIGMDKHIVSNFFNRPLPTYNITTINEMPIESNRGEGFILAYREWKNNGGDVEIINSTIGQGTKFLLTINGIIDLTDFSLNENQLYFLTDTINKTNKKIILLIDDLMLNLKIMCHKLIKCINTNSNQLDGINFPTMSRDEWQNQGIHHIELEDHIFIFAANGMYGKEIVFLINEKIDVIVTDIQMPQLNGIDMIKCLLDTGIKTKIYINSGIVEKGDNDIIEILTNEQISYIEKGSNIDYNNILNKVKL